MTHLASTQELTSSKRFQPEAVKVVPLIVKSLEELESKLGTRGSLGGVSQAADGRRAVGYLHKAFEFGHGTITTLLSGRVELGRLCVGITQYSLDRLSNVKPQESGPEDDSVFSDIARMVSEVVPELRSFCDRVYDRAVDSNVQRALSVETNVIIEAELYLEGAARKALAFLPSAIQR